MARLAAYSTRLDAALQTGVVKSRAGEALSILSPTRWMWSGGRIVTN